MVMFRGAYGAPFIEPGLLHEKHALQLISYLHTTKPQRKIEKEVPIS